MNYWVKDGPVWLVTVIIHNDTENCLVSGEIDKLIMMDTSYDMVKRCESSLPDSYNENIETSYVVGDEEFLPIKER